jgi:2-oxoglutarate dehydrogenase E2 component (dihydrolipoamide succinyltransferase)
LRNLIAGKLAGRIHQNNSPQGSTHHMSVIDLEMPKLGESIMEATILKWLKQPGDAVQQDETVLEIATDKVDSEVPSTTSGILEEILFKENDVVPIGTIIARIRTNGEEKASAPTPAAAVEPAEQEAAEEVPYVPEASPTAESASFGPRFYSPLVLKIAQEEGVSMSELERIPGSGQDNRVSKKDILAWLANRGKDGAGTAAPKQSQPTPAPSAPAAKTAPVTTPGFTGPNTEIVELDRMRRLISKHMVDSKHTSAHVTSFTEADVTNLVMWREKVKKEFEKRENDKITYTPLFVEAIVKSIKKYPWLNSSIDGDNLLVKKYINIGMATALPSGNLIVPVIKNADQLSLVGLSKQVNLLANAARNNKLKPDDTQDGTFTMTNVGTFGSLMGTPIINQPQVAILAVGAIKKRPVVVETPQGDTIGIRHMMYLSLSYDHRIIDGALGSTFLNEVAKELENWDVNRSI